MYRGLLLSILLLVPGSSLAGQHAREAPNGRAAFQTERVLPHASMARPIHSMGGRTAVQSMLLPPSLLPPGERQRVGCPEQSRRFLTGAAIGLVVGGAVGYASADRLPNPGVGDVPPEAVYVPLFALPSGVLGGLIGAYTGRRSCPPPEP